MASAQEQAILKKQRRVTTNPYYSKWRFVTALTGGGGAASTYTIAAGTELRAFGYGIGGDMGPAGRTGVLATFADTNLQSGGRTIGGQQVHCKGLAITLLSTTFSAELLALLWPETSVRLSLNGGETNILLGLPHMYPGAGGISGQQTSNISAQPIPGGRPAYNFAQNGLPGIYNCGKLPEGFVWRQEGCSDSNLNVLLRNERAVVFVTQLADEAAAAGIRGFANPAAAAVFVEGMVQLVGTVTSKRSAVL